MSTQNRKSFLTTSALITAGLAANVLSAYSEPEQKGIIHQVFFWLKNPDSKEDLAKLLAGLESLRKINAIKKLHIGVPAATEKRDVVDQSYQASELMFFENLADQKSYQDDPLHQKFIADCSHLWSKVVVYDVQEV